ncbi:MAG: hypothetical protein RDU30_05425 [Desulfovibrionaceae bacterium]|nr:hypothetical protein [Desulfovibrionaceae bacterium]
MPYTITWKTKGVIWAFHGTITGQDGIKANQAIYGDPRFDDLQYEIVDLSRAKQFKLSAEDVETAAALDEAATLSNPRLVVAIVTAEKEALRLAELYKSAMSKTKWKVEIFSAMEDAENWVSLLCEKWA